MVLLLGREISGGFADRIPKLVLRRTQQSRVLETEMQRFWDGEGGGKGRDTQMD